MKRVLRPEWFAPLTGCLLYLAVTGFLLRPSQFPFPMVAVRARATAMTGPSWDFRNPEFDQWLAELKSEKEGLAQREQQLHELETRLDAERQELLTVTQTVHQLQADFDRNVVRFTQQQAENLKRQTKIIEAMTPEGAAAMLEQMPEDEVVRILFALKADAASLILDTLSKKGPRQAKQAATLAERLRLVLPPGPAAPPATTPGA